MTDKTQPLQFSQLVLAPPKEVYRALTHKTALQSWLADVAEADARENGRFYLWWNEGMAASGKITALEEDKRIAFTWNGFDEPAENQVEFTLAAQDGGTQVTVSHAYAGTGENFKRHWPNALLNLQSLLERGLDKRFYDRPMLGIQINPALDDDSVKRLGVPVAKGIWISGTLEGSGAASAGLLADDVIVKMDERDITDFDSLRQVLEKHKAGDELPVEFYRGAEKKSVQMKLSHRPIPEVPPTAAGFAAEMRKIYAELDAELDKVFEGVSEEHANKRPAEKEWSAKETVAHLLYTEHWGHAWITTTVEYDIQPNYYNVLGSVAATANAYPTVAAIVAELKRCEAISAAAIEALPEDFLARKFDYYNLAAWFLIGVAPHHRNHFEQMKAAIRAARGK